MLSIISFLKVKLFNVYLFTFCSCFFWLNGFRFGVKIHQISLDFFGLVFNCFQPNKFVETIRAEVFCRIELLTFRHVDKYPTNHVDQISDFIFLSTE